VFDVKVESQLQEC